MDLMLCEEFEIVAQDAVVFRYHVTADGASEGVSGRGVPASGGPRRRIQFAELPASMGQLGLGVIRPQDVCRVYAKGRPPRVKRALSGSSIHKAQVRVYFPDTMSESEMQAKLAKGFEISSISRRPDGILTPEPFPDSGVVHLGSVDEVIRDLDV